METFVTAIHVITASLIILAVLLQGGNQGGMGAAFGGGNSSSTFGAAGSTSLLGKITYITATVFMITSIWLTILQGSGYDIGLTDKLSQDPDPTTPLQESQNDQTPQPSSDSSDNPPLESPQPSQESGATSP